MIRQPFKISENVSKFSFKLIHSDVWGLAPISSKLGHKFFVIFIDDKSKCTWVYFLKYKNEVSEIFKEFHQLILTQYNSKIKVLRIDNGMEYVNSQFDQFFKKKEPSIKPRHETSQQNGVSERKNRHILNIIR